MVHDFPRSRFHRRPFEARHVGGLCVAPTAGSVALDCVVLALQSRTLALAFDSGLIKLCLRRGDGSAAVQ